MKTPKSKLQPPVKRQTSSSNFEAWFAELVRLAKEELGWKPKAVASIQTVKDSMREYYDEGLTPKEAWCEEYSAAQ